MKISLKLEPNLDIPRKGLYLYGVFIGYVIDYDPQTGNSICDVKDQYKDDLEDNFQATLVKCKAIDDVLNLDLEGLDLELYTEKIAARKDVIVHTPVTIIDEKTDHESDDMVKFMDEKFGVGEQKAGFLYYKRETAQIDVGAVVAEKQRRREQYNAGIHPQSVMYTFDQVLGFAQSQLTKYRVIDVSSIDLARHLEMMYTEYVKSGIVNKSVESYIKELHEKAADLQIELMVVNEMMSEDEKPNMGTIRFQYFKKGEYVRTPNGVGVVDEDEKLISTEYEFRNSEVRIKHKTGTSSNPGNAILGTTRDYITRIDQSEYDQEQN